MKKLVFILVVALLVFTLNACGDISSDNVNTSGQVNPTERVSKLTLEDIKERYLDSDVKIKNIQNIGKEHILVQSQKETFADRFDIYNLQTGDMDSIQEGFDYLTLEKIVNENYFIFLSSGRNSESIYGEFPYLVKSVRIKNELNAYDDFISFKEDKYFDLDYSLKSGSKENGVLSEIVITLDGFEVMFEPMNGDDSGFYTAATDIPPTKTSYNEEKKQMTFELTTNQIGNKFKNNKKVDVEGNQYISSFEINQKNNMTYLIVGIKDITKEYMVKMNKLPDQLPYFSVSFREQQ